MELTVKLLSVCLERRERERDYPRHLTEYLHGHFLLMTSSSLSPLIDQVDSSASKFDCVETEKRFIVR